jgi:hypothetical protein
MYAQAFRCFEAFPTFYAPLEEPESPTYPHDVRVKRFAARLAKLLPSPHILATKAVLTSGPDKGKLVGFTIWHRPSAPEVFNLKRPWSNETEEDEKHWVGVHKDKWEAKWAGWDKIRERIMDGIPHWCAFSPLLSLFAADLTLSTPQTSPLLSSFPATKVNELEASFSSRCVVSSSPHLLALLPSFSFSVSPVLTVSSL